MLLEVCGGGAVNVCRRFGAELGADVYVSPSPEQAESDVKAFENMVAMHLTMQ